MINVKIDYCYDKEWDAVNWQKVRENWPVELPEEKPKSCTFYEEGPCRVTIDEAMALSSAGLKVVVTPLPGAMVMKMQNHPRGKWDHGMDISPEDVADGRAIQISVPDMALMWIDEVEVREDCCTHELQGMLDDGWRILAVCPPNAQRRPDYILGRRKERKDPFDVR